MTETWFDTRVGDLLIGREAAADRIDEAGPDIVPLRDILLAKDFMWHTADLNKYVAPGRGLSRQEYINFGQWALNVVSEGAPETPTPLTSTILKRLNLLGLGPTDQAYRSHGLKIANLSREIAVRSPDRFKNWEEEDYVSYGVRVVEANGPGALDEGALGVLVDVLSAKGQRPERSAIDGLFENWDTYGQSVREEFQGKREIREEKLARYRQMIDEGILPEKYRDIDDDLLLQFGARHILIHNFTMTAYWKPERKTAVIEASSPGRFTGRIAGTNMELRALLESKAEFLGVQEDIWPDPDQNQLDILRVTPEELAAYKRTDP